MRHSLSFPAAQAAHWPQETPGASTTLSPACTRVASSPTRGDFAGDVAAGNERQRKGHAVQALADPEVEMVQRAGVNADQDFVGAGLRIGDFGVLQNFGPAVLGNEDRPH